MVETTLHKIRPYTIQYCTSLSRQEASDLLLCGTSVLAIDPSNQFKFCLAHSYTLKCTVDRWGKGCACRPASRPSSGETTAPGKSATQMLLHSRHAGQ